MPNQITTYLPNYYRTSKVITDITDTQNQEIQEFIKNLENTFNQFFIDTADFSLERWEKELGIPVNNNKPNDYRRSAIKSKLKGSGTITVNLIKNVCQSYSNGEVDIIEDTPNMRFTVKFTGVKGAPPNLDDLQRALEEIKPAHLAFEFEFTYNINAYLHNYHLGWLGGFTNEELRTIKIPKEVEGLTHEKMGRFTHRKLEDILYAR